jgi:hypothetical protein
MLIGSQGLLVGNYTWQASNTLVRVSIILPYIRLFPVHNFRIICWLFIAENLACWTAH